MSDASLNPFRLQKSFILIYYIGNDKFPVTKLSKISHITYAHTYKTLRELERRDIIATDKIGTRNCSWLTKKGLAIYNAILPLKEIIGEEILK